jgi:hypothetical protein
MIWRSLRQAKEHLGRLSAKRNLEATKCGQPIVQDGLPE